MPSCQACIKAIVDYNRILEQSCSKAANMYYRQKILLALLESFGGKLNEGDFQKHLFLYTRRYEKEPSYEFVPLERGHFSFQSEADKSKLVSSGYLKNIKDWHLSNLFKDHMVKLKKEDARNIHLFRKEHASHQGEKQEQHFYHNHSSYRAKAKQEESLFATIGYEGVTIENYLNKLIENNIRLLVDVRKNPLSRKFGFSKTKLSELLGKVNIGYRHLPELGIVSNKRKSLKTAKTTKIFFRTTKKQ